MSPRKQITYSEHPTRAARSAHAKGEKAFRTYDTSYIRPKRSPLPAIIGIVVLIVALIAIIVGFLSFTRSCTQAPMLETGKTVEITVSEGEGAKSVAKSLYDAGLIASTNEFTDRIAALGSDAQIQPGTYTLTGGQSVDEIISTLQKPIASDTFTVPEGLTVAATAEIVEEATGGRIKSDEFVSAASDASRYAEDYSFLAEVGDHSLEGFLFPKTYPYNDDSTAESLIRAMLDQFESETANLNWSYVEERGMTHYDAVKLASIVEKEADEAHRSEVASVFYNRLSNGMRLESDATVAYFVGHDPTADDVATYDDYNTYFIDALPPTPINSPSLSCLESVCSPADTPYLYFYFEDNGEGGLNYSFSETYEEHQATYE